MLDDAYARLVAEEVKKNASQAQIDYLSMDLPKWQQALLDLVKNLNGQIDALTSKAKEDELRYAAMGKDGVRLFVESDAIYQDKLKKVQRFLFHVENRLDEVTRIIAFGEVDSDERLKTVEFLRRAIEKHRELVNEAGVQPSDVDYALWASLDGKWAFAYDLAGGGEEEE